MFKVQESKQTKKASGNHQLKFMQEDSYEEDDSVDEENKEYHSDPRHV